MINHLRQPAVLVTLLCAAAAPHALAEEPVDLVFKGGTAGEYAQAIREAAGEMNVLVQPEAAQVPMAPVTLKRVLPQIALLVLDDRRAEVDGRVLKLNVRSSGGGGVTLPVYNVTAEELGRSGHPPVESSAVWSLRAALESGLQAEDVLTAIETALALLDDRYAAARLRFHEETQLLLARAHPEQIGVIQDVIGELTSSRTPGEREQELMNLQSEFEREMMQLMSQVELKERESADAREEAARTRHERDDMRQRLIDTIQNLEAKGAEVQTLQRRVSELEGQLEQRRSQP